MLGVAAFQLFQRAFYQLFTVVCCVLLIEAGDVLHRSELHHDETSGEDIRLEHVVLGVPRVTTLFNVCSPKQWR